MIYSPDVHIMCESNILHIYVHVKGEKKLFRWYGFGFVLGKRYGYLATTTSGGHHVCYPCWSKSMVKY